MLIDLTHNGLFAASFLVSWWYASVPVETQGFMEHLHSSRSQKRRLRPKRISGRYACKCISEPNGAPEDDRLGSGGRPVDPSQELPNPTSNVDQRI